MRKLFEDIKARVLERLPDVQYCQMYNNQDERVKNTSEENELYAIGFPAVLVEYASPVSPEQVGFGYQVYNPFIIRLHLLYLKYDAIDGTMDQNLDVLDYKDELWKAFQDHKFDRTGILINTSEILDTNHNQIYHYQAEFTTSFVRGGMDEQKVNKVEVENVQVSLNVDAKIDNIVIRTGKYDNLGL